MHPLISIALYLVQLNYRKRFQKHKQVAGNLNIIKNKLKSLYEQKYPKYFSIHVDDCKGNIIHCHL